MTEHNYFCCAKEYGDEESFQQKKYRIFNVEVSKEEFESIEKLPIPHDFSSMTENERQKYFDIPNFNIELFNFITN